MTKEPGPTDVNDAIPMDPRVSLPDGADERKRVRMAQAVAASVRGRATWRSRMSDLSTPARVVLGVCAAVAFGLLFLGGVRPDLAVLRGHGGVLGVALAFGVASVALALRPMHRVGNAFTEGAGVALTLALPVVGLVEWPGITLTGNAAVGGAVVCGGMGALTATLAGAAVLWLDRQALPATWRVWAAAAAGGWVGFVFREIHCMASDPFHMLSAHLSLSVIAVTVLWPVTRLWRLQSA